MNRARKQSFRARFYFKNAVNAYANFCESEIN